MNGDNTIADFKAVFTKTLLVHHSRFLSDVLRFLKKKSKNAYNKNYSANQQIALQNWKAVNTQRF